MNDDPSKTMIFTSEAEAKAYVAAGGSLEGQTVKIEPDTPAPVVAAPPISTVSSKSSVNILHQRAGEAALRVSQIKSQRRSLLREHDRLGGQLEEAEAAAAEAVEAYRAVMPRPPLPPTLSFDQCLAEARRQRPLDDERTIKQMAARLHSSMSDGHARAGEGIVHNKPIPPIEGPEVHNVEDHKYNLHGPGSVEPRQSVYENERK